VSYYDLKFPRLRIANNPHQREVNCAQAHNAPFLVIGPQSPLNWLKALEEMAYYFKREQRFEFPTYSANERFCPEFQCDRVLVFYKTQILDHKTTPRSPKDFTNAYTFFGAIGVRWQQYTDAPATWSVPWVWLHPYERRKGHLTNAWPCLLKMFPNPSVEQPISPAMTAFLQKVGHMEPSQRPAFQI
jgi:hypothetical protein